jgi:histidinol-phosphate/aromatic aminotransferase/cobyric acid decarboxylase-like protein
VTQLLRSHGDTVARPGELDFAVNVWPERDAVLDGAIADALRDLRYPSEAAARAAVATRHGRDPDEVLLLNGACEGFWLLAHALRPARAACVHPSFTEPEAALRAVGCEVVHALRDPETWALPDVSEDVVVVGNPNNPTGNLDDVSVLLGPGRLLVVDESFMDFVPGERHSLAATRAPGLVVLRSLTKLWSLAGVRAGYLLAEPELVARLAAQRQPWSVNAGALAALVHCAADRETPARVAAQVAAAREQLRAALPYRTWPGAANFLLAEGRLEAPGFALRSCDSFPGLEAGYTRIAVRRPEENARLVEALCR